MACKLCKRPDRDDIDAALRVVGLREVARSFNISYGTLYNHKHKCLAEGVHKTYTAQIESLLPESATTVVTPNAYEELTRLKDRLERMMSNSEAEEGKEWLVIALTKELRATIETMLKVWSTQKELELKYAAIQPASASKFYEFMRTRHPDLTAELAEYLKEARQGPTTGA